MSNIPNCNSKIRLITVLILTGIGISYINQMSPAPLLLRLADQFKIVNNDALLNLSITIMYPMMIAASIAGGFMEQRLGTRKLYTQTLVFLSLGILINYLAATYTIFLLGRMLFGIGFGLGIPFIGSAIMKWFKKRQQELMNTVNSLFPFIGALISFALIVPIFTISGSWKHALGIWGFGCITVLVLWVLLVKDQDIELLVESDMQSEPEKGLYLNLWKRKAIKLLVVAFSCDFLCYSYIATILPTLLLEVGNMSETAAGYWSAIAFPAMGIVGASIGGIAIAGTSRRKPSMAVAQLFKFTGIMSATLGAYTSVWFIILGIALFGLGNSMWMPGMYMLIMELEDMNPSRVGAAFALISSCGFVSGFVSPIVGGWLTNQLMLVSHIAEPLKNHVFGLKWSLFIFGFSNLIAFASILKLKETDSLAYVQGQTGTKI